MTDWPSFWVNLATAVFTGGTFIMGLFMIPRTRWRMRTIDNKTEDGLSKVHIVLENVGITDVTDVDVTSTSIRTPSRSRKASTRRSSNAARASAYGCRPRPRSQTCSSGYRWSYR